MWFPITMSGNWKLPAFPTWPGASKFLPSRLSTARPRPPLPLPASVCPVEVSRLPLAFSRPGGGVLRQQMAPPSSSSLSPSPNPARDHASRL